MLREKTPEGARVGFFRITDPDHEKPRDDGTGNWQDYQNKMSLSILNSHQLPWFKIVYDSANSRHEIRTTKTETDYETEPGPTYKLTVLAKDEYGAPSGFPDLRVEFLIIVQDIPERPTLLGFGRFRVAEDAVGGSMVGDVTTAMIGATDSSLEFSLVDPPATFPFVIDSCGGLLSLKRPLDFETAYNYELSVSVGFRVNYGDEFGEDTSDQAMTFH